MGMDGVWKSSNGKEAEWKLPFSVRGFCQVFWRGFLFSFLFEVWRIRGRQRVFSRVANFKMSVINVTQVNVLNNPAPFTAPLEFEVHYEAMRDLEEDLEWKIIYFGEADTETRDQELESVLVGPVKAGKYKFVFQADSPDPSKIPEADLIGMTVVLLTCSYNEQEFIRIGYYASVDYADERLREDPPTTPQIDQLERNIVASDPRLTHYTIDFGPKTAADNPDILNQANENDNQTQWTGGLENAVETKEATNGPSVQPAGGIFTVNEGIMGGPLDNDPLARFNGEV